MMHTTTSIGHDNWRPTMDKTMRSHGLRLASILLLILGLIGALTGRAHAAGTTIASFYPATSAADTAWKSSATAPPPPRTTTFPSGTRLLYMYVDARGAVAHSTQYVIVVHDQSGATFLTHGPFTFPYKDTLLMSPLAAPHGTYPDGSYSADLRVDGSQVASTSFTVGAPPAKITMFYTTTKAAYDNWPKLHFAPPPRVTTFPHGLSVIAFYYSYQGAQPNKSHVKVVITTQSGAPVATAGPFVLPSASSSQMSYKKAPSGAYPDGSYHVTLMSGGSAAASGAFTVGSTAPPVKAVAFYTATKAADDAWRASSSPAAPPKTSVFPHGTTLVAFYFHYLGARPHATQFSIIVHGPSGGTYVSSGPYTLLYTDGYDMDKVTPPSGGAYPDGTYSADLILAGRVSAHTTFTIRSVSAINVQTFYPATKAAYDAWNASNTAPPPPHTTTFRSGTTVVAFYFAYTNATVNLTQFTIVVHNQSGATVATHGPYALTLKNALHMSLVDAPAGHAYADGSYSADLLIDGKVVKSAAFTVAPQGVSVTSFYPATLQAYTTWMNATNAAAPPQTTSFSTGATTVAAYFVFSGGTANKTLFKVVVRDHTGGVFATDGPYTLSANAGAHMSKVQAPFGTPYPNGAYRVDLDVDNKVVSSAFFTVGTQPSAQACSSSDVVATCIEPSVLRLHANLPNNQEAEGTGFVIQSDASGTYLLTNKHVVDGATAATMTAISPNGHTQYRVLAIQATTAAEGTAGDLAVIKIQSTSLRPLTWGDSNHLRLLERVYSIGYGDAFNLPGPPSVTEGSISALHRDMGDGYGAVWIQHQSFINHGNSGGPLLDEHFNVVGVNTLSPNGTQGIFLAIPSSLAEQTARQLISQIQGH